MPSWQRSVARTVQYSGFRATIPSNIHASRTIHIQGLSDQHHDNHGFTVTHSETLETFDRQRRYDGNRRAYHVVVEQFASDSEYVADGSSDDLYDSDINDESGGSDDSDESEYVEAKGNVQAQLPHRPKLDHKTYKQEIEEQRNAVKPPMNFYQRLGLQRDATEEEFKAAARKMRIQVHPHRLITAETSEDEAKRINEKASEVGEAAASLLDYFTRKNRDEELQRRE